MPLRTALIAIALLAITGSLPAAAEDSTVRLIGGAEVGYDSFSERYSILDSDTVDSVSELRTRLRVALAGGSLFGNYAEAGARYFWGENSNDWIGHARTTYNLSPKIRMGLDGEFSFRNYPDDSDYEFANPYQRGFLRTYSRFGWDGGAVQVSNRLERLDFENRTEFDYDYTRNTANASVELNHDFTTFVIIGMGYTYRDVPDSAEIAYDAYRPALEFRWLRDTRRQAYLSASAERRVYAADTTRSPFWHLPFDGLIQLPVGEQASVKFQHQVDWYRYDADSDVYFDYLEQRGSLLLNYHHGFVLTVGAGPAFGHFSSDSSPDDEYQEWGLKMAVEYIDERGTWLNLTYEVGKRDYDQFDGNDDELAALFSDYTYQRLGGFATVALARGWAATAFADISPEDHEREGDDATATLFSLSLGYRF